MLKTNIHNTKTNYTRSNKDMYVLLKYTRVGPRNRVIDTVIVIVGMRWCLVLVVNWDKLRSHRHCPTCRWLSGRLFTNSRQRQTVFWRQMVSFITSDFNLDTVAVAAPSPWRSDRRPPFQFCLWSLCGFLSQSLFTLSSSSTVFVFPRAGSLCGVTCPWSLGLVVVFVIYV